MKMIQSLRAAIALIVVISAALPAHGHDFYPISGATASTSGDDLWPVANLISGVGVGFESDEPHDQIIVGGPDSLWVTAAPGGYPADYIEVAGNPVLTFDMGADVLLGEIAVWGYSNTNSNGVNSFSLKFATSEEGMGGFGSSIEYNPTFDEGFDNDDNISMLPFVFGEKVTARYVELQVVDNFFIAPGDGTNGLPGGDRAGLGEVAFSVPAVDLTINGGGETYFQNFDAMATVLPDGWNATTDSGPQRSIDDWGLENGPLGLDPNDPVNGIVNVGGNPERFTSSDPGSYVPTWSVDLDGNGLLDDNDVVTDAADDRALGTARPDEDQVGRLGFEASIVDKPLRAFTLQWDLEVWGGDPDADYRGGEGGGFAAEVFVGGVSYHTQTESLVPGAAFHTFSDGGTDDQDIDSSLIDGNVHKITGISTGLIEVDGADGAIGNKVNLSFDANFGDADAGWIPAIDNVQLRAVAPGDVDGNGSVDPLDIVELLKGGQFGKGVNGVTWQQGDFNGDDQFDPNDLVAVLTFLNGQFPTTYASENGNPTDTTPDVLVDPSSGEIIVDFAGHTSSSVIIDSAAGIFNGDAPAWDTMGEFRTASANQLSNTMFNGTESGVDNLGDLLKAQFMDPDFDFLGDLTVKILVATPDGPVTVDGHVIVIPEPSTWMLLGLGSLALVVVVRRRMA